MSFVQGLRDGAEVAPLLAIQSLLGHDRARLSHQSCPWGHIHRALVLERDGSYGILLSCNDQWLLADLYPGSNALASSFFRLAPASSEPHDVARLLAVGRVHSAMLSQEAAEQAIARRNAASVSRKAAARLRVDRSKRYTRPMNVTAATLFGIGLAVLVLAASSGAGPVGVTVGWLMLGLASVIAIVSLSIRINASWV